MSKRWMIYGATGYTGKLIAEEAAKRGLKPILAGRSLEKVKAIADRLGLESQAFDLKQMSKANLSGINLVLHCAGPFSQTSAPMVAACLSAGAHYLDITGEIDVFEHAYTLDDKAKAAGVVLMPGVGFDVVPSDCLAKLLQQRLPDANELSLAIATSGKASPGTLKTSIESLPHGTRLRRNGKWEIIPAGSLTRSIPFSHRTLLSAAIPWGDLASAYRSTGIPNITTYMATPPKLQRAYKVLRHLSWLTKTDFVQDSLKRLIEKKVQGPTEEERMKGHMYLWGEVKNASGKTVEATLRVPEGYRFTVLSALACVDRMLVNPPAVGALTPAQAFGAEFLFHLPEVQLTWLEAKTH